MVWGNTKSPKVEARIESVAVQCFPVVQAKRGQEATYQVAATATVTYQIDDVGWLEALPYGLYGTVIFEAVSANGVVLASKEGEIRIVRGLNSGTASAMISGLSGYEIQHVFLVQARWEYGR